MKYEQIDDVRRITVRLNSRKNLVFTVPLNFNLTEEYIRERASDPKLTECLEWLKENGFIEEERGWSYHQKFDVHKKRKSKRTISIPAIFFDKKTMNLRVKFHRIEGAKVVKFPRAVKKTRSKTGRLREVTSNYSTLNNFPDYMDCSEHGINIFFSLTELEKSIYNIIATDGIMLNDPGMTIDDAFLVLIVQSKNPELILDYDPNRFNIELIKKLDKNVYNTLRSIKGISKFNL